MRSDKRGVQRPVEIFFVLFIITASVLLTAQLILTGITSDERSVHNEQYQRDLIESGAEYCQTQCQQARRDNCSLRSLARLCVSYASDTLPSGAYLDLNRDDQRGVDQTQLAGIGLCEGSVPCHAMTSSCCGQTIDAASCEGILRDYWAEQNMSSAAEQEELFREQWETGQCKPGSTTMWWEQTNVSLCDGDTCQTGGTR